MKKIIVLGHSGRLGGSEIAFERLCIFLSKNYDVLEFHLAHEAKLFPSINKKFNLRKLYFNSVFFSRIFNILYGVYLMIRFKPDIFITVGLNKTSLLLNLFSPKDCISVAQDYIADRKFNDPLLKRSYKSFTYLAFQSKSMLEYYKCFLPADNLIWLPCFSNLDNVLDLKLNNYKMKSSTVRIGYFGRVASNKGLDLVIKSLKNIDEEFIFDIWGQGPEIEELRNLVNRLNLNNKIMFRGRYPSGKAYYNLLRTYDFCVLCSTKLEGLPLVLLEFLSCGVPFLATNIGSMVEFSKVDGLVIVEPNQVSIEAGLKNIIAKTFDKKDYSIDLISFYNENYSNNYFEKIWFNFLIEVK